MLPIRENVLHLDQIAEYWSRELGGVRTPPEIYAELLAAFWQGALVVVHAHNLYPIDRESMLKAIDSTPNLEHPGFTLVDSAEMIPPKVEQHPDGRVTVDQGIYIVLPLDHTDWTDEIVRAAYDEFAKLSFDDFHELLKPPIYGLGATQEAFAAYCDLMGWGRPRFWFGKERKWDHPASGSCGDVAQADRVGAETKAERRVFRGGGQAIPRPSSQSLRSDLGSGGAPKLETLRTRGSPTPDMNYPTPD
jgi:hypothetical protein